MDIPFTWDAASWLHSMSDSTAEGLYLIVVYPLHYARRYDDILHPDVPWIGKANTELITNMRSYLKG